VIIDFSIRPPLFDFMQDFINPPKYLKGYESLYADRWEEAQHFLNSSFDTFLGHMDEAGVKIGVCRGKDIETTHGLKLSNDTVASFVNKYPQRFIGFAGVDPLKGMEAVRELERAVKVLGLKGLALEPFEYNIYPDDRRCYPLYAKCVELDIPVSIHCSINYSSSSKMDYGHPRHIDTIAVDFPELRIVAMTPGWPWVTELIGVAWRHRNVFIELAAVRPKYMNMPNTGWGELVHYGNTVISDKILFASGWPLLPISRSIQEINDFPLKAHVKERWFYKNAANVLKLDLDK